MTSQEIQFRPPVGIAHAGRELRLSGVPASPGVAIGFAHVVPADSPPVARRAIGLEEVDVERERLTRALEATRAELLDIREKLRALRGGEEAKIFDAHLLMLEDPHPLSLALARIEGQRLNAEAAFFDALSDILRPIEQVEDSYLRERAADIRDVKRRVLKNLGESVHGPVGNLPPDSIVLAHDLSPTVTAELDKDRVLGFATEVGSSTSHTAILARSLEIPAVVGLGLFPETFREGDRVVLDGNHGLVIRNPSEATIEHYRQVAVAIERQRTQALTVRALPSVSRDGRPFELQANIETPREVEVAHLFGAEGIGLFRTEFLFMRAGGFPDEEQQYAVYREIVEGMRGRPVTVRTLDLGGDKMPTDPYAEPEANPFLGWRAIRYSLDHPDLFRAQVRAILRASAHGPVRIMFPLISSVEELRRGRSAAEAARRELVAEGVRLGAGVPVGAMVETPAAALLAGALAHEADFLSIGTNDLTQYTLAVDRGNMRVAGLFRSFHPAVLLLVERTVRAARETGIDVALCGEMASSARAAVLLFGMGLSCFSMIASKIPKVKAVLRETTFAEAQGLWERCRELRTAPEVEELLNAELGVRLQRASLGRLAGEGGGEQELDA